MTFNATSVFVMLCTTTNIHRLTGHFSSFAKLKFANAELATLKLAKLELARLNHANAKLAKPQLAKAQLPTNKKRSLHDCQRAEDYFFVLQFMSNYKY